jgi:Leucine-rich repeat (LRR) protein
MNQKVLLLSLVLIAFISPFKGASQAVDTQDSLALVDLYNSTNGPGWTNHNNWLTSAPVNTWYGVLSGDHVGSLSLAQNRLMGPLPSSLGNLSQLGQLNLSGNGLTGPIPSSFGNLTMISNMDLSVNQLTGSIPAALNNLENASILKFSFNLLSGNLPDLTGLSQFVILDLSSNHFTFTSFEGFQGPISTDYAPQADIPLITNGNVLSVAAGGPVQNNTYTWFKDSSVVATIYGDSTFTISSPGNYMVSVSTIVRNRFDFSLVSISTANLQDSLTLIDFYNNTGGNMWTDRNNWLTSAPLDTWSGVTVRYGRVTALQFQYNNLQGTIPSSLGNLSDLTSLQAIHNQLSGSLPSSLGNLSKLGSILLVNNQLSGSLPSSLGNLSSMSELALGFNQFSGSIPSTLGNLTSLYALELDDNEFTDTVPSSLGNLSNVISLDLSDNQLTGNIPSAIGNLSILQDLNLADNRFSGSIPSSLGNLSQLQILDMSNNQLTDSIPPSLGRIPILMEFMASDNQLSGVIPDSLSNCTYLSLLLLYDNLLTGKIPDFIGNFPGLIDLELQNNRLSGPVPSSLSQLQGLDSFNIANNDFTFAGMGKLPPTYLGSVYYPQAVIPLIRKDNILYVSAGSTMTQDTFKLYKDGALVAKQIGDSAFTITEIGKYYIVVTNASAPLLTLYSDTLGTTLLLPDSTISFTQVIAGVTSTDITSGIFNLITLTPSSGNNALSGNVTALETIDTAIASFNGAPYVERHYDITPEVNAANAQATVTLYFTQQDFDTYNSYITFHNLNLPLLPTGGVDNGNVIITQYHGAFSGTAIPANYSQGSEVIAPVVVWDTANNWWTVTFPVSGFSGFFASTGVFPLPLTLLQFTGLPQGNAIVLQWQTTNEVNTRQFIIQRASDDVSFASIGTVTAKSTPEANAYNFTDNSPLTGNNFYRLKMADLDGHFTYSPIVLVRLDAAPLTSFAYPNPAHAMTSLVFNSRAASNYSIQITDLSGKKLSEIVGTSISGLNKVDIDVHGYAAGVYTITIIDEEYGRRSLQLNKD